MSYDNGLLRSLIFWIAISLCLVVFIGMLYALINYRRMHQNKPIHFHKQMAIEILWVIIPFIMIMILLTPAINHFVNAAPNSI